MGRASDILSTDEAAFASAYYNELLAGVAGPATSWLTGQGVTPDELRSLHVAMQYVYGTAWEPQAPSTGIDTYPWSTAAELRQRLEQLRDQLATGNSHHE